MTKQRLNIELFKKVRAKIARAPEAYDQSVEVYSTGNSPCGTAACIGGWADILSAPSASERDIRIRGRVNLDRAANALGLGGSSFWGEYLRDEATERMVLFTGDPADNWPEPFAKQWRRAKTSKAQAKIAVAYLDHIIETGKVLE
jgi:hypothetical protein